MNTRVRIPPSPTGLLHLGTARTALFNYLFAKKQSGEIVFRWEDTDKERSKTEFETDILDGLKWLGLDFVKESVGIFRQSDNLPAHKESLQGLWETGKVFPCFCTPQEIDDMREEAKKMKTNFIFWSPFRAISVSESEKLMKEKSYVWRLRCPKGRDVVFTDLIRGDIKVNTNTIGDFTVARADGSVLYPLANVLDDVDQEITHVLRGEDGISNTPKQLLLFEALEATAPEYGHIPLVLDHQKRKLSKRNVEPETCVLIDDFRQQGFLPESVLNGLAFLGWNPKSEEEVFEKEELIQAFDLKQVRPAGSQYDFEKMRWYNNLWMNRMDIRRLMNRYYSWTQDSRMNTEVALGTDLETRAFEVARVKSKTFLELQDELSYLLEEPDVNVSMMEHEKFQVTKGVGVHVLREIIDSLETSGLGETVEAIKEDMIVIIKKLDLKNGTFLWPLRVALSGREKSANAFEIMWVLGKEKTQERLEKVLKDLSV